MAKEIKYGNVARVKIKAGVDKLANAVKSTLGPSGKNVVINKKFGPPVITKDGVSVAKEIELEDPFENIGAQLTKEAASKTNDQAGDGTTGATVIAQSIYNNGLKFIIAPGTNSVELKKGIDKAVECTIDKLKSISKKIDINSGDIEKVATISANNDQQIGKFIAEAMRKVGSNGVITVEESKSAETKIEVVDGMELDRGYISPYFVTDTEKMIVELENPYILITDKKLSLIKEIVPILESIAQSGRPLLIIADDVEGEALTALILNKIKSILKVCAVKAPGFGDRKKEILEDISILTGGTLISEERGLMLDKITIEDLGRAEKVTVTKDNTTIINGHGNKDAINNRINQISAQIINSKSDYDKEKLEERRAKLSGGVAVIYIGAATEVEMKEKKDRIDDALHATKAAAEEGVVPGGGIALLKCREAIKSLKAENEDQNIGFKIVYKSLSATFTTILENSGEENPGVKEKEIMSSNSIDYGYNVKSGKYENFYESGVLDPTKVIRIQVESSASIASMMLTTECVICEKEEKQATCTQRGGMDNGIGMM